MAAAAMTGGTTPFEWRATHEMKSHSHPLEDLAFACLERMAVEGADALETVCVANPEHAAALRHLVEQLRQVGLTVHPERGDERSPRFGEYRIDRRLGGGGMGVVHLAWQERLQRPVALKLLRPGVLPMPRSRARFRREVAALSRLDHPHICTVYDAGEVDGVPFLAMRYVAGDSLAERIERARADQHGTSSRGGSSDSAVPFDELLILLEKVVRAVHAAHEAGVVHRDLKPANIMIDERGEPAIVDFGLAHDDHAADPGLTRSTDQLGTPSFMAPEQLDAGIGAVDRRTDVYQLGVTAYQCLTLRLPFDVPAREGVYRAILTGHAPEPRALNRRIGRELSAVVMRAMARVPAHRFATALELAEELERVRTHRPIRTRRPGPLLRLVHWCQRNPVAAVFLATLGVGLGVALVLLNKNVAARQQLEVRDVVSTAREVAQWSPELAFKMVREAERRESRLEHAEALQEIMGRLHEVDRVDTGAPVGRPVTAPGGEWVGIPSAGRFHIWRADGELVTIASDPDGLTEEFAIASDGSWLAVGTEQGRLQFYDAHGVEFAAPLGGPDAGHDGEITCVGQQHGLLVAGSADGAVSVWSTDRARLTHLPPDASATTAVAISPDRRFVVLGSAAPMGEPALVRVLEVATGRTIRVDGPTSEVVVGAASDRFAVQSYDGRLDVFAYDGTQLWGAALDPWERSLALAVGPRGERLAVASSSGWIRVYDRDGSLERQWRADPSQVGIQFSPDGRRLLTVGYFSQRAQVWDLNGNEVASLAGHLDGLNGATFTPDGAGVVSGSTDGTVRRWQLRPRGADARHVSEWGLAEVVLLLASAPERDLYLASSVGGALLVLDRDLRPVHSFEQAAIWVIPAVSFAADGRRVGLASFGDGRVSVLDLDRGTLEVVARVPDSRTYTFSILLADGRIVTNDGYGPLVLDPTTGSLTSLATDSSTDDGRIGPVEWMDMTADRGQLCTAYGDVVSVWYLRDDRLELRRELPHPNLALAAVFSRDGERILTGCDDGVGRLWDLASDRVPIQFGAHLGHIRSVCLSPDEALALTVSSDGTVSVWDTAEGAQQIALRGHRGKVWSACFTPDGRQVISSGHDGIVRRWWIDSVDVLAAADALGIPELTAAELELVGSMQRR